MLGLDFDKDIVGAEQQLINTYGFLQEEVNFVMRYNPKFILLQTKGDQTGIKTLEEFFVNQKGFELDAVRTLVVRYPYVLSKTRAEFEEFFQVMNR